MAPICRACGLSEYYVADGLYYCNNCDTESRDLRVEEQSAHFGSIGRSTRGRQSRRINVAPKIQKKSQLDKKGRPWSSYEFLQLVLLGQVDALIRLGASPKLKSVVWALWTRYLNFRQVAFCVPSKGELDLLFLSAKKQKSTIGRWTKAYKAEHDRLFTEGQPPEEIARRKKLRVRDLGKKVRTVESGYRRARDRKRPTYLNPSVSYEHKMTAAVERNRAERRARLDSSRGVQGDRRDSESDLSDDGRRSEMGNRRDSESDLSDNGRRSEMRKPQKKKKAAESQEVFTSRTEYKDTINKKDCLCLCYLGLLITNNQTTLADLVKYVKLNKIPFINPTGCLHADMKFSCFDRALVLDNSIPTVDILRRRAGWLANRLDVTEFPRIDLGCLCNRYIIQLKLPADLHGIVNSLVRELGTFLLYRPTLTKAKVPAVEAIAMAFIVMALKQTFGLNDSTEFTLSQYSRLLNSECDCGPTVFVWDKWLEHAMDTQTLVQNSQLPLTYKSISGYSSLDRGLSVHDARRVPKKLLSTLEKSRRTRDSLRANLQKPFESLVAVLADRQVAEDSLPSRRITHGGLGSNNVTSGNSSITDDGPTNFRRDSLEHITNASRFVSGLRVRSSARGAEVASDSTRSDGLPLFGGSGSFRLYSTRDKYLEPSLGDLERNELPEAETVERERNDGIEESEKFDNILKEICEKTNLLEPAHITDSLNVHKKYVVYLEDKMESFHKSYRAVLQVCSEQIESSPMELHAQVDIIQFLLMKEMSKYESHKDIFKRKVLLKLFPGA